jgi:hypothetical protein
MGLVRLRLEDSVTSEFWPEDEAQIRQQALRRPFECELPGTADEFAAMVEQGERRGWPDVVRAGMYGLLRHAAEPPGADPSQEVTLLLKRAEVDGDLDMLALSLAWRAWVAIARGGDVGAVDDDLAKAAVMLESADGDPVIKTMAHFRISFCFMSRCLWELADEQFAAAEVMVDSVDPMGKDPLLHRAALAFNRVMVQLDWGCALREAGDLAGVRQRRQAQERLVAVADCIDMPPQWREHVRIAGLLLDVLAGAPRIAEIQVCL